jgi:hypothetical protein
VKSRSFASAASDVCRGKDVDAVGDRIARVVMRPERLPDLPGLPSEQEGIGALEVGGEEGPTLFVGVRGGPTAAVEPAASVLVGPSGALGLRGEGSRGRAAANREIEPIRPVRLCTPGRIPSCIVADVSSCVLLYSQRVLWTSTLIGMRETRRNSFFGISSVQPKQNRCSIIRPWCADKGTTTSLWDERTLGGGYSSVSNERRRESGHFPHAT